MLISKTAHHLMSVLMAAVMVVNQLLPLWSSPVPPTPPIAADPAPVAPTAVADQKGAPLQRGTLRFSPFVDDDGDAQTNPLPAVPVPVLRYGNERIGESVLFGSVRLAVELQPTDPLDNPAGTAVTFRLWDDVGRLAETQTVIADVWGAAALDLPFNDLYLDGRYSYSADAVGFGATGPRAFTFDTTRFAYDMRLGEVEVTATTAGNGLTTFEINSRLPIPDEVGSVTLELLRATPTADAAQPQLAILPPLVAQRIDAHSARAHLFLETGDYIVQAQVTASAQVEATSLPLLHQIAAFDHPAITQVEAIGAGDGTSAWVRYRTADGEAAFVWQALDAIPADRLPTPDAARTPDAFVEQTRIGPFEYRTDVYTVTTQVLTDDGAKYAILSDFHYDPLANSFSVEVHSKLDRPIHDRMTVDVYGPNGVVIYTEEVPVYLDPQQPFRHQVQVPSDVGQPQGVRVLVHDPFEISFTVLLVPLFFAIEQATSAVFDSIVDLTGARGINSGWDISASFKAILKVVTGLKLLEQGLYCTISSGCAFVPPKGLFYSSSFSAAVISITADVRDYLRSKFKIPSQITDIKEMVKSFAAGFPIGSLELVAGIGLQYTKTLYDPGRCPTKEEAALAKTWVDSVAKALDEGTKLVTHEVNVLFKSRIPQPGKPFLELPLPGLSFITLSIEPLLAFKVEGNKASEYQVFLRLGPAELGLGGKLTLKIPLVDVLVGLFDKLETISYLLSTAQLTLERYKKLETVIRLVLNDDFTGKGYCGGSPGGGGSGGSGGGRGRAGGTPRLNGNPDDRLDAFQTFHVPLPRGVDGDIYSLQSLLEAAERNNFQRAATFLRRELAQAELTRFEFNPQHAVSRTLEIEATTQAAQVQIGGLISGTILPAPGDTITDAVYAAYEGFLTGITTTSIDLQRTTLQDALAFADVNYQQLRGQELELQYELRQLLQVDGVGVVDGGYVVSTLGALGSFGVRGVPVQLIAGDSVTYDPGSRYYAPHQAPRVLIVPSGGLYRYAGNAQVKAWLDEYVTLGGTLLVLAQAESIDLELLPGRVRGLGYTEDIFCRAASVTVDNSSIWLSGVRRNLPDLQLDGSFLEWPANATILLTRTTGNLKPAMIEYPYGLGRVVATALYPDFYMNGLQSAEDLQFARAFFTYAGLLATNQAPVGVYTLNSTPSVPIMLTNTTPFTATRVTVFRDYYDNSIGDSWRWAAHAPNNLRLPDDTLLTPPLPPGASRVVNFAIPMPVVGFARLAYTLGQSGGYNFGRLQPGRFYQVLSPLVPTDLSNFQLTTDQINYPFGATATVTVRLQNDRAVPRTFDIAPLAGLNFAPQQITVAAGSAVTYQTTTIADRTRDLRVQISAGGSPLSTLVTPLRLATPRSGLSLSHSELTVHTAASVTATLTVRGLPPGSLVQWRVLQDNSEILSAATTLTAFGDYLQTTYTPMLPAAPAGTRFVIEAKTIADDQTRAATLPVFAAARLLSAARSGDGALGTRQGEAILAQLRSGPQPSETLLSVTVLDGSSVLTQTQPATHTLAAGETRLLLLDLPLPARVYPNATYTILISGTARAAGAAPTTVNPLTLALPIGAPTLRLAESRVTTAGALEVTLDMPGGSPYLAPGQTITATLAGSSYAQLVISDSVVTGNDLTFSVPVPDDFLAGDYTLGVQVAQLIGWYDAVAWLLPPAAIRYALPATANAGDTLTQTQTNLGGEAVTITGTLTVKRNGLLFAETTQTVALDVGASAAVSFTLPAQMRSGDYSVRWLGFDEVGRAYSHGHIVRVNGLATSLTTATDAPLYLPGAVISTTTAIASGAALSGSQLRLRVLKPTNAPPVWDGWLAEDGSDGDAAYVGQAAQPPFSAAWQSSFALFNALPVAADNLVYAADYDGYLYALDSSDGAIVWQSPISTTYFATDLALNSAAVYAAFSTANPSRNTGTQPLAAFDRATGALLWQSTTLESNIRVSDAAVVTRHNYSEGWEVRDPLTGALQRVITPTGYTQTTLLVGDRLLFHSGGMLESFDTATGTPAWSVPINGNLLAADAQHVAVLDSGFDLNTFTTVYTLTLYDSESSALVGTIGLSAAPDGSRFVLGDDHAYYVGYLDDGGGSTRAPNSDYTLYRVDFATATDAPLFSFADYTYDMAGTGDLLQLLLSDQSRLLTLDSGGNVLGDLDLSGGGNYFTRMAVSGAGVLLGYADNYSSYTLHAFSAAQLLGAGNPGGSVLRELWLPADGSGTYSLTQPLINPLLGADPAARGNLYLEATLFAAEPAANAPADRQPLATAYAPFTIAELAADLLLQTAQPRVRLDRPTLAADDAASVVALSGLLRNATPLPTDITISVTSSAGGVISTQTFANVAAGATVAFSAAHNGAPQGVLTYTVASSLGGSAQAGVQVVPVTISALAEWLPATLSLGDAATLRTTFSNNSDLPAWLTADLGDGAQLLVLAAGDSVQLTRVFTPTAAGLYMQPITLTGDATGVLAPPLTVTDNAVTATVAVTGTLRAASGRQATPQLVAGQDAQLTIAITNPHSQTLQATISYAIAGTLTRTQALPATLYPGDTLFTLPLSEFPPGSYQIDLTIRAAADGRLLGSGTIVFDVVAPRYQLAVDLVSQLELDGGLLLTLTATSAADSEQPFRGSLLLTDNGDALYNADLTLMPGQTITLPFSFDWAQRSGVQTFAATLSDAAGMTEAAQTLAVNAAPRLAPLATLSSLSAAPATAGGNARLTLMVANAGPAGELNLLLSAFDVTREQTVAVAAYGNTAIAFDVPVPGDLIDGLYRVDVQSATGERLSADVAVSGAQLALAHTLDAAAYMPASSAIWHVSLHGVSGAPAPYDLILRYRGETYSQTLTIGAGDQISVTWPFTTGHSSGFAHVIVQTHVSSPDQTRRSLLIDSERVTVIASPRGWITTDKPRYSAGETILGTYHAAGASNALVLLGDLLRPEGPLVWSSLLLSGTVPVTATELVGSYPFSVTLPATVPTGRYHLTLYQDGAQYDLPFDLHGIDLLTEQLRIEQTGGGRAAVALTIHANLRLAEPLAQAVVHAFAVAPDDTLIDLGASAVLTTALPAGVTPVTLSGTLLADQPAAYKIVLRVTAPDGTLLGGEVGWIDVGAGWLTALDTDHAIYAPATPGVGTVGVYGTGTPIAVVVTTSDLTPVYNQIVTPTGFTTYSFSIPTASVRDEVLIATATDSLGLVSVLQRAYKVVETFDLSAPTLSITSPTENSVLVAASGQYSVTVSGIVTDDMQVAAVLVNGISATLTMRAAAATWLVTVPLQPGVNTLDVLARDVAGNQSEPTLLSVTAEPAYGITLSVTPPNGAVEQVITYQAVVTSSAPLSATVLFPFSLQGLSPFSGAADSGLLDLNAAPVTWTGVITPGTPITLFWRATATQPLTRTISALVIGNQMAGHFSNEVDTVVIQTDPTVVALRQLVVLRPLTNGLAVGWFLLLGVTAWRSRRRRRA